MERRLLLACCGLLGLAAVAHAGFHFGYVIDDAYISFRYARNLVRGAGLVYNPGDYVQGFSNPLYTLLAVIPQWLGWDPGNWGAWLGIASLGLACALIARFCVTRGLGAVALCALALIAASSSLALWHAAALETGFYTLLITAGVLRRLDEVEPGAELPPRAWLWFCAAVWCRPEGILLFGAMAAHDALVRLRARAWNRRDLAFYLGPPAAYALQLLLSKLYYGAWLPQTFQAKVERLDDVSLATRIVGDFAALRDNLLGDAYVAEGLASYGGPACLLLLVVGFAQARTRPLAQAIGLVVLAQLAFIAHVRGDWMHGFRFMVPVLPLLFVGLALPLAALELRVPQQRWTRVVLALGLIGYSSWRELQQSRALRAERWVDGRGLLAEAAQLDSFLGPGRTVSSFDVGAHGYGTRLEVLDTGGLTSRWMQRMRRAGWKVRKSLADAIEPDLVRLQRNGRDKFLGKPLVVSKRYLELPAGRGALRRALVFPARLPEGAVRLAEAAAPLRVVAHRLPRVAAPGAALEGELFLRREGATAAAGSSAAGEAEPPCPLTREVWFERAGGGRSAVTLGRSRLAAVGSCAAWEPGGLYADWLAFRAPEQPGRYTLHVKLGALSTRVLELRVTEDSAELQAAAAAELVQARAQLATRRWGSALQSALEAQRIWPSDDSRRLVHQAAIEAANAAQKAERPSTSALREARYQLYRAYFLARPMSDALREAVDRNGRLWDQHLCRASGDAGC
jgi:hypothetical protein